MSSRWNSIDTRLALWVVLAVSLLLAGRQVSNWAVFAQENTAKTSATKEQGEQAEEAGPSGGGPSANAANNAPSRSGRDTAGGNSTDSSANSSTAAGKPGGGGAAANEINVFDLAMQGGIFMYPIYALSLLAVGVIIERFVSLRRDRVFPTTLVQSLGQLGNQKAAFDPRRAYRLCQEHPSAAATVIKAMLLKVGRPHSEVEHTVQEVSGREANRLYSNVRWLNLCATVTPLIGLLGTVQGMIIAFHQTTVLAPGANKAVELANGIYTALVTTFGGLCVAIPASMFAHYFEGRIQSLFGQIDELLFNLLPLVERYENRLRFGRAGGDSEELQATSTASGAVNAAGMERSAATANQAVSSQAAAGQASVSAAGTTRAGTPQAGAPQAGPAAPKPPPAPPLEPPVQR
ncbi:MAG: MotA/TolQ/ExbB proton channel family protein [Planctomycetota bacterium]